MRRFYFRFDVGMHGNVVFDFNINMHGKVWFSADNECWGSSGVYVFLFFEPLLHILHIGSRDT